MLSRLHRKAETLDQACLRAQGHPLDYAIREELLSALEWDDSHHPVHARPLIRDLFKEVQDHSIDVSNRIRSAADDPAVPVPPIAEIPSLRRSLAQLLQALAMRHDQSRKD